MTEIDFHTTIFNCYALWILPCVLVCVFLNFCLLLFFYFVVFVYWCLLIYCVAVVVVQCCFCCRCCSLWSFLSCTFTFHFYLTFSDTICFSILYLYFAFWSTNNFESIMSLRCVVCVLISWPEIAGVYFVITCTQSNEKNIKKKKKNC